MNNIESPRAIAAPVVKSLFAVEGLAEVIAREYGLEDVRCQLLKAITLDTYLVRSRSASFALRVYPSRRRPESEVRGELEFLERLDAAGVPVTVAVPRTDGTSYLPLEAPEGTRIAVLFPFAPGLALSERPVTDNIRAYAALLARVHDVADAMPPIPSRPPLTVETLVDEPRDLLVSAFGPRSSSGYMASYTADMVRPTIAALSMEASAYGFCHGDAGISNALVTGDGRITLLDFDFCGPAWRAHDVAVAINEIPGEKRRDFLDAYRAARPFSDEETESIAHFQAAHYLWVLGMRTRHLNEWGAFAFPETKVIETFARIEALLARIKKRSAAAV
jgi:Ser/Thr protein kinase RdoA (MazF antagonist)